MRSVVWDEISAPDMARLRELLGEQLVSSGMEGVYWLELPERLLSPEQAAHTGCRPHRVAVIIERGAVRMELLVRSSTSLRCNCTAYATAAQREYLLEFMDAAIERLKIRT